MGIRGTVLVIDDSPGVAELLAAMVEEEGFRGVICTSGEEALAQFDVTKPVAVLLDWVMPDLPGTEICRDLRKQDPGLVVMFVSGRDDEASISRGLDAGADDFIVKPVRRGELISRLEAHLRKVRSLTAPRERATSELPAPVVWRFGEVQLDPQARLVTVAGEEVALGRLEFKLLEYLCNNAGVAVSRERILSQVYGYEADISTERVDLLVRRLRAKLGEGPERGGQLVAVAGYGYRMERPRA